MTTHSILFLRPFLTLRHLITNSNNKTQNDQKISHLDDKIINSWLVIPYFLFEKN